jgi:flagellin
MRINQNVVAFNAYRNLSSTSVQQGKSLEKLSSGFRINRAADDAAGLVISEKLRSEVRGLNQAVRNAQDGVSLVQTAEGALTEVHEMLQRIRELAVQKANTGVYGEDGDAATAIDAEITELVAEINRIGESTKFGNQQVFDGESRSFQVGAYDGDTIDVTFDELSSDLDGDSDLAAIDAEIDAISTLRGTLGATQNRLEHTVANLSVTVENLQASESRIRDTDMAQEMVRFTRHQILAQAGTAMLAQANQVPQSVLSLLR